MASYSGQVEPSRAERGRSGMWLAGMASRAEGHALAAS
jgi:hypothetical protein